ncbi:MAG: class I SAM-dependent methyltransferase [Streptosporangiaceae bacterium]
MSHSHSHSPDDTIEFTPEFWDDRYRSAGSAGQLWSGQPNPQLVAQAADLAPGEALDAGSGEGADAIWLARHGWIVTAADVSTVALDRAAGYAAAAGDEIARRITWQQQDLRSWDPGPQRFDLVSAQFMHLPGVELVAMHARLAAAVRPGGTLLVVGHQPDEHHAYAGRPDMFRSAEELAASLDPGDWDIVVATAIGRSAILNGEAMTVTDAVVRAARRR